MFDWLTYPIIDPIALAIGPLAIRWYGIAYVAGILLGRLYLVNRARVYAHPHWPAHLLDDFIVWIMVGIVAGGRLGHVLFYDFNYYAHNMLSVFKIWEGGMSFHGGLIGVLVVTIIYSRHHNLKLLPILDWLSIGTPIGLFFGRIANFINGELFGRVTTPQWGIIFPHVDQFHRHPSQLYEAFGEGVLLFVIMAIAATRKQIRLTPGRLSGIFLINYAIARIFTEQFREPDANIGYLLGATTWGQWLSFPMIVIGIYLVCKTTEVNQ